MAFGCSQITVAAEPPPGTTKLDSVSVTGTRLRPPSELPQSIGPSYGPTRGSSGGPSSGGGGIGGAQPQNAKSVDNSAVNDTEICPTDNPVIIGTGEKLLPQADAESAGLYGMSLRRTYRSKNGSGSMFGTNWPSTFDPSRAVKSPLACIVTEVGCIPRDVSVTFPSGAKYIYTWMPTSPGEYQVKGSAALGTLATSRYGGTLLEIGSSTYSFNASGVQTTFNDTAGVSIAYSWQATGTSTVTNREVAALVRAPFCVR